MSQLEKILAGVVGVAMVTTLILPGRQTPAVIEKITTGFAKILGKAMGT